MHCPKCGQTYGEGSQRFCDLDGVRLVFRSAEAQSNGAQRVFSTILPITDIAVSGKGVKGVEPDLFSPVQDEKGTDERMAELFFEPEDDDDTHFSAVAADECEATSEPADDRVFGRKVSQYDIPAGHVEINQNGEREHPSVNEAVFDIDDPGAFVGHRVKGRYQVVDMLGEDDTGFAYLAEDRLADDKRVMVRILTREDLDEVTESIFAEERISLSHLNHPNIVRVMDSGQFADGTTFLISERVDALSVADILHINGPLDAGRVARIIRQAGEGLSEVHNEGILHRDLRPEDLAVIRSEGEAETVKLSEFGVSDGAPNDENLPYKAPEILDGRIPTIASDVYSLGVIAYQALTGRLPFSGDTPKEMLRAKREEVELSPTALRRDIAPSVDYVFERVLSSEPLLRYPTAREFGEALYAALTSVLETEPDEDAIPYRSSRLPTILAASETPGNGKNGNGAAIDGNGKSAAAAKETPENRAWKRRSPEPLAEPNRKWGKIVVVAIAVLLIIAAGVWYYLLSRPTEPAIVIPPEAVMPRPSIDPASQRPDGTIQIEVPPLPREIRQPPNTEFFQNSRQNLKGDILRNFVGFTIYYPKDWKSTGPQESTTPTGRGKFLDISHNTPDGKLKEQMLIGYYPSTGTYTTDAPKFGELAREANETLKKLIPNYQMVSVGETSVNGGWRAYEIKFQGTGTGENGQRLLVWGRRLFLPASRPGVRAGFEITMLATSDADDVHSVDDVGTRGELGPIFATFEPTQNF